MENATIKILIVDDEPDITEFLEYNLAKEGYQVSTATNGLEAINKAKQFLPHLILLDIMMPGMDGVETCHHLRKDELFSKTIIAFLTARSEEYSQIAGLEAGADDYIQKPIRPRLLTSRIKALLRRFRSTESKAADQIVKIGTLIIDKERYKITMEDTSIDLAKKEFDILWLLASRPGKVFSRSEIYSKIWGNEVIVGNRTIDVHISKLRDKLGDTYIRTVKGIGYKLEY